MKGSPISFSTRKTGFYFGMGMGPLDICAAISDACDMHAIICIDINTLVEKGDDFWEKKISRE
ncbi:predicted protein [Sclerotinia sclerotiorum 1980 UF-70]|uniref:Uncharacterized protein n=1 Tax=Sclerotinia sclerotiorum (strain ATCC 18683 / 1980 / Ss-1) TaxID=665079 RepID=A7EH12_SCLS1|nr:predicted protein [Sclerotinia sclerotiorum 1980 UF-70]EDO02128.1 predicted protein [Sclerotinia sclerotiorum 1980 UF-70]